MGRGIILITGCLLITIFSILIINSCGEPEVSKQWYEQAKITAGAGAQADSQYGCAVAVSDSYAVVGAYLQDKGGIMDAGAVYIYKRSGTAWNLYQTIEWVIANNHFGYAVDIYGTYIIIGAPGIADPAVYIYKNTGSAFVQTKKLTAGTTSAYGSAVAIDKGWAIVGDKNYDWGNGTAPEGAVYVYSESSGWNETQKLHAGTKYDDDWFGIAVDISGSTIAVGAPRNDTVNSDAGAVYLFEWNGSAWGYGFENSETQKITYSDGVSGDYLGYSLSISEEKLVAGGTGNGGTALIFEKEEGYWVFKSELVYSGIQDTDKLGFAVGISGSYAVAGTSDSDLTTSNGGGFYIFKSGYKKWDFFFSYSASDNAADDRAGSAVAISGDYFISGAPGCAGNTGAAYIFFRDSVQ